MTLVKVGILDSGLAGAVAARAVASAAFTLGPEGEIERGAAEPDLIGHGTAIARLVLEAAPEVEVVNAQIFSGGATTTAAAAAAGLDWLRIEGARLVSMSFGLRGDRGVLRYACEEAARAGIILVGAAPARGAPVFPSSYTEVIAVTGDARCGLGQISTLYNRVAEFGACPRPPADLGDRPIGGASFAVGHACGILARALVDGRIASASAARGFLDGMAHYRGRECKGAEIG